MGDETPGVENLGGIKDSVVAGRDATLIQNFYGVAPGGVGDATSAERKYLGTLIGEMRRRRLDVQFTPLRARTERSSESEFPEHVRPGGPVPDEFVGLLSDRGREEAGEGIHVTYSVVEKEAGKTVSVENIEDAMEMHRAFALIGEPGAGKTTTLRRLALDHAERRLRDRSQPLPLLISLPSWPEGLDFVGMLEWAWEREGLPNPARVEVAVRCGDVLLLLDGLNEMATGVRAERAKQIREWLEENRDGRARVIVTCREREYGQELELGVPVVRVDPLDDDRIREFAIRYLGEKEAEGLLEQVFKKSGWRRYTERDLIHLARNPYMLAMLTTLYVIEKGRLPRSRGLLFRKFVRVLWDREERHREHSAWVPHEQMEYALGELAWAMIDKGAGTSAKREWAMEHLPGEVGDREGFLKVAVSAQLLDEVGGEVRFYHQLMGEYFAAMALRRRFEAGQDIGAVFGRPRIVVFGLREVGKWDEVVVTLAGVLGELREADASRFVGAVAEVNPFLALDCIEKGPAEVDDEARERVVDGLAGVLGDGDSDVRQAAAWALGKIGDARAVEALVGALGDEKSWVRKAAARALGKIGDARAVKPLMELLSDTAKPWRSDERVCDVAAWALERIGTEEALEAVRRWREAGGGGS